MSSTYSTNLGLELMGTGDQSGTWGITNNTNLGTLIEQAISGYQTQAITDGADTIITIPDGASGVARNMYLELTGALTATRNLIVPAKKKLYFIYNNTTGSQAVTVKVSGLTGVSVPNGAKIALVCNGTDIVDAVSYFSAISVAGTANGVAYLNASKVVTTGSALTFDGTNLAITGGAVTARGDGSGVGYYLGTSGTAIRYNSNADNYIDYSFGGATGGLQFRRGASVTPVLTLGNAGNVTIAAPSSGNAVTVNGLTGTDTLHLQTTSGAAGYLAIGWNAGFPSSPWSLYTTSTDSMYIGTQGTASISFYTSSANRMQIGAGGNVSINTPASGTALTVTGLTGQSAQLYSCSAAISTFATGFNVGLASSAWNIYTNGADPLAIGTGGASTLSLYTAGAPRITANSAGNVTINAPSSGTALTVTGIISANSAQFTGSSAPASGSGVEILYTGTVGKVQAYNRTGSAYLPLTLEGSYLPFNISGAEAMRLDTSSNLGLGVTPSAWGSPFKALDMTASAFANEGTVAAHMTQNSYYNGTNWIYKATNLASRYLQYAGQHIWYNAPSGTAGTAISFTQPMTLDASGNLMLGTTSVFSASRMTVQGNATYTASFLGTTANTTSNCLFLGLGGNRSTDTTYSVINYVDTDGTGTARFRVYGNGNVVNTNNSYGAISDIKVKENIVDATPKLDKLLQVRVVNYNLIGEPDNKQLGVVAQELEQIFPAMVSESPDVDAEGNDLGTTTKSVKYSVFVPMLIKAMQEQQALIEKLTARIAQLEAK